MIGSRNAILFDTLGGAYTALTEHALWAKQNQELAKHWGELGPSATVLELGPGTGIGTLALEKHLPPGARIIGVDIVPAMVARAKRRLERADLPATRVEFRVGDATALSEVASNSVHAVVANSFLYLVPEPAKVLAEIHRVLAPGGRVVFMEPCAEVDWLATVRCGVSHAGVVVREPVASGQLLAAMTAWFVAGSFVGRRSRGELTQLFRDAGFDKVEFKLTLSGLGQHVIAQRSSSDC